jgi:cytochrome c-type biogenesis protein CcmH/NrfG
MPKRFRYAAITVFVSLLLGFAWHLGKPLPIPASVTVQHRYSVALDLAQNGKPGAARLLYQQLAREDLSALRQAHLLEELPNYPSSQALKLASARLASPQPVVRHAAIQSISRLVSPAQLSLLLGPLLADGDPDTHFHAARQLLALSTQELGLYLADEEKVLDRYVEVLEQQPDDSAAQLQLAQIHLRNKDYVKAAATLARLPADTLDAVPLRVSLLEAQHQADAARQVLAEQLRRQPQSAFLQSQLGHWLQRNGAPEYALLALTRAVELEPDHPDYRYDLALALHGLDQTAAAQHQLDELLRRDPANRKARVLLIEYWKESGQLQNVQVLLAELEQQNPDDPLLQQVL